MPQEDDPLPVPGATPEGREALRLLLTRYSVSAKHLREPGPGDEELWAMAMAALRAPDHEKRVPFRFLVARGEGLERLAALFVDYGRRHGKAGPDLEREREKATQAPVVIAVIARINPHDDVVPPHEQWMAVGGAVANFLNAAHALGFAGKMLSGDKARSAQLMAAFCAPGETLVGWVVLGTPVRPPRGDARKDNSQVLSYW